MGRLITNMPTTTPKIFQRIYDHQCDHKNICASDLPLARRLGFRCQCGTAWYFTIAEFKAVALELKEFGDLSYYEVRQKFALTFNTPQPQ
jgi:hypothetical protein